MGIKPKGSKYAKYRRILTGTPVTQGPLDLYTQLTLVKNWNLANEEETIYTCQNDGLPLAFRFTAEMFANGKLKEEVIKGYKEWYLKRTQSEGNTNDH